MTIIFEIPAVLIILVILCGACGLMAIAGNIAYILFNLSQIALVIMGVVVFVTTVRRIIKTKRIYLLIPALAFLVFTVTSLFLLYSFFCMSENYTETINLGQASMIGQKPRVYVYALLICLSSAVIFMALFSMAFSGKVGRSLLICLLCLVVITAPVCFTYRSCNQQQYDRNVYITSSEKQTSEEINIIWKEINYSANRFPYFNVSYDPLPVPCNISAGTTVYLSGETMRIHGEDYCEIFLYDAPVIGYVKIDVLK